MENDDTFKFVMIRAEIWFLMLVWTKTYCEQHFQERDTEMFDSLPGVSLSSQQNGVCALWCPQSQLIQSDDFTTGLLDPLTRSLGDSQSGDAQLGDLQHSHIVRD